jgi:ferritin
MESSHNENVMITDGENKIGLNEWNMEDQIMNESFQIEQNTIEKIINPNENNEMEKISNITHKEKNEEDIIKMQFVGLFIINGYKEVDPMDIQVMKCVLCCNNLVCAFNPNTNERK